MKNRNLSGADAGRYAEGRPNARSVAFDHFGSPQGVMAAMYPYMFQDTNFKIDDFDGFDLDLNLWDYSADSGGAWSLEKSYAIATTGAVADGAISIFGPETLRPSKNCGVEFRFQLDSPADFQLEAGFINRLAGEPDDPIISDIDTPAAVTNNTGAVFHIDTGETYSDGAFVLSANGGATVAKTDITSFIPTEDNWYTLRVQAVFDNSAGYKAHYYLWDTNASRMTLVSTGFTSISASTAATNYYRPFFLARTLSTTEKNVKIDYIARWQDR